MDLSGKQKKTESDFRHAALRFDAADLLHHTENMIATAAARHARYARARERLAGRG